MYIRKTQQAFVVGHFVADRLPQSWISASGSQSPSSSSSSSSSSLSSSASASNNPLRSRAAGPFQGWCADVDLLSWKRADLPHGEPQLRLHASQECGFAGATYMKAVALSTGTI